MTLLLLGVAALMTIGFGIFVLRRQNEPEPPMNGESAISSGSASTAPAAPDASLKDPVTDLYTRKHLFRRLADHIARCDRTNERMAVILWDIDGFVAFNNTYGQAEGDRFLRRVADVIRKTLRVYDEAFRAGGDEFCAVLMPANDKVPDEVMKRVSQTVSRHLFDEDKEYAGKSFSISAGLVFYPGESSIPEGLLHAAGQSLYRNRTEGMKGGL